MTSMTTSGIDRSSKQHDPKIELLRAVARDPMDQDIRSNSVVREYCTVTFSIDAGIKTVSAFPRG
jgi:hypothetical protein